VSSQALLVKIVTVTKLLFGQCTFSKSRRTTVLAADRRPARFLHDFCKILQDLSFYKIFFLRWTHLETLHTLRTLSRQSSQVDPHPSIPRLVDSSRSSSCHSQSLHPLLLRIQQSGSSSLLFDRAFIVSSLVCSSPPFLGPRLDGRSGYLFVVIVARSSCSMSHESGQSLINTLTSKMALICFALSQNSLSRSDLGAPELSVTRPDPYEAISKLVTSWK